MRRLTILLLAIVAFAASVNVASGKDGCGSGQYYDGNRCASLGYRYDLPGAWGYDRGYNARGYNAYARQNIRNGCPPRFINQNGVCKPSRVY